MIIKGFPKMFIIPVKYDKNYPYIINLIKSIRLLGHKDKILIIDSNSQDKTYFKLVEEYNVEIADIDNKNYIDGAIWYGYENYTNENFFYILHDTMQIKQNLEKYKNYDFTSFSYFDVQYDSHEQFLYVKNHIESKNIIYNSNFYGLFGITFFCKRKILDILKKYELHTILPSNKLEMMGSERIWGFYLNYININITENSIAGKYKSNEILTENPIISKYFLHRL